MNILIAVMNTALCGIAAYCVCRLIGPYADRLAESVPATLLVGFGLWFAIALIGV